MSCSTRTKTSAASSTPQRTAMHAQNSSTPQLLTKSFTPATPQRTATPRNSTSTCLVIFPGSGFGATTHELNMPDTGQQAGGRPNQRSQWTQFPHYKALQSDPLTVAFPTLNVTWLTRAMSPPRQQQELEQLEVLVHVIKDLAVRDLQAPSCCPATGRSHVKRQLSGAAHGKVRPRHCQTHTTTYGAAPWSGQ